MLFADVPNGNTVLLAVLIGIIAYCFWPKDEKWDDDDDDDNYYDGLRVTNIGAV